MNQDLLKEAFSSFLDASKSLENYFLALQEKIDYLTKELEKANLELKNSLEEKERTNNFLETVLNSLDEAIIVLDRERTILMFNNGAKKLLKIDKNGCVGKHFSTLGFEVKKEGENQFLIKDGKHTPVIYSEYTVKNGSKEENGKIVVIKDISRIKEIENHYERNKRLIAMGEMAAKIVHEIRSPLCSIELFASMLREEEGSVKKNELVEGIIAGIGSLNNILNNMLYFARERKVRGSLISLSVLVDEVLELFKPLILKKKIKLKKIIGEITIFADVDLLKQAIFNILQNAYYAVDEGGVIVISSNKERDFIALSIKDNGHGISKENINKIFDPFYTTRDSGTGLGLAITLKIIEAHKGFIEVNSEVGKGSEFKIFIPLEGGSYE
ncbi:MAG: ATP-binding protein [Thermodesulfovibrio sp.]|nr:ATP-binding protein [Thermodesulfovibrio sp.]